MRAYTFTRMDPAPSASTIQSGSYHTKNHMIYMNMTRPGVRSRGAVWASEVCLSTPACCPTFSLVDAILIFDRCTILPYRRSFGCTKCPRLPLASLGLVTSTSLESDEALPVSPQAWGPGLASRRGRIRSPILSASRLFPIGVRWQ